MATTGKRGTTAAQDAERTSPNASPDEPADQQKQQSATQTDAPRKEPAPVRRSGERPARQRNPSVTAVARVGVVDDHPIARYGISAIINADDRLGVTHAVAELAELPDPGELDVLVVDLHLGGNESTLAAIAPLSRVTRVLALSSYSAPGDVLAAIRAGACGYLPKRAEPPDLLAAVRTVLAGGFALSAELAQILWDTGEPELSPREQEALRWLSRGFTPTQTATRMRIGKTTVDGYVARIRSKLQEDDQ